MEVPADCGELRSDWTPDAAVETAILAAVDGEADSFETNCREEDLGGREGGRERQQNWIKGIYIHNEYGYNLKTINIPRN